MKYKSSIKKTTICFEIPFEKLRQICYLLTSSIIRVRRAQLSARIVKEILLRVQFINE